LSSIKIPLLTKAAFSPVEPKYTTISDEKVDATAHLVIFWEGLVLIMAIFYRDIGELQYRKVVVESGSRRYVEIQLFFHKFRRFCRLPSLFSFRTFGEFTKAYRAEIKIYFRNFMRLFIAHTPVPLYLPCELMAIRSFKSKSTDIFPIFRESYLAVCRASPQGA